MFEVPPESTRTGRSSVGSGLTSLVAHSVVIALAAMATRASLNASPPVHEVAIPLPFVSVPKPEAPPTTGAVVLPPALHEPVVVPTLPPIAPVVPITTPTSLAELNRRISLSSAGELGETLVERGGELLAASGVWSVNQVDEPAAVEAAGALRYPPTLQAAGISGQVVLEFVVDTTGRAELASVRVVSSTHPGFEPAARDAALATRFSPGRASGLAVRQLVRQTLTFVIR